MKPARLTIGQQLRVLLHAVFWLLLWAYLYTVLFTMVLQLVHWLTGWTPSEFVGTALGVLWLILLQVSVFATLRWSTGWPYRKEK
jgi:hypothetical protein